MTPVWILHPLENPGSTTSFYSQQNQINSYNKPETKLRILASYELKIRLRWYILPNDFTTRFQNQRIFQKSERSIFD